jgi:uncharacterized protein YuzE
MEMKLRTKYDEEADAAYIYVDEAGKVDKTLQLGDGIMVDIDRQKKIVGIEILNAKSKIHIPGLSKVVS